MKTLKCILLFFFIYAASLSAQRIDIFNNSRAETRRIERQKQEQERQRLEMERRRQEDERRRQIEASRRESTYDNHPSSSSGSNLFDLLGRVIFGTKAETKSTVPDPDPGMSAPTEPVPTEPVKEDPPKTTDQASVPLPDVDVNIPVNNTDKNSTYALIIGNEDYSSFQTELSAEVNVAYALNDAKIFKEYCIKTLGIPDRNVILVKNGTGSKTLQNLDLMSQLAKANKGNAELIFYYAGHGLPDEQTKEPYLIPVDVSAKDLKYAIKLSDVYKKLTENPSRKVSVFLDACFSGGARKESLVALRSVKIKPKESVMGSNMVVFTSSSGEESSAPYEEKQHGMFTYYLLKKLQDSRGNCTYNELDQYLKNELTINSLVVNRKQQNPQILCSPELGDAWKSWRMR